MRRGFSMLMAIFFLVLVATLGMFALNLSSASSKHTTDIFLREQAELLAQGATEMAVQNLLSRDLSANCPTPGTPNALVFNSNFPANPPNHLFTVNVRVVQLFGQFGACGTPITTAASAGTVILDVEVTANQNITNVPVRFYRRTIQKL